MYTAHPQRYERLPYRTVGKSGLKLPSITLGLCRNFGDATLMETQRAMRRTALHDSSTPARSAGTCGSGWAARTRLLHSHEIRVCRLSAHHVHAARCRD